MADEIPGPTPKDVWRESATPDAKAKITAGVVKYAMSMGQSPQQAADLIERLDDETTDALGFLYSGVADGATVKDVGKTLRPTT
ncbi:hypothetical protein A2968_04255 [Candidatus Gottesmanbacteria bacterium RIFCSPLOWO2_01_FULL_42_22]|uniref:Uncharacterized protein n=1 Tax=Candidatus Gottesmanbacteria bacterium RIFCSPLOWO2_01_FULL_42_22 TaxID=1798391 RepID=A0A1F6BH56_9BACT|nr:MAG: hypothetical protein A2968_04255 [Candidatus Gottesmanbacteria bacterium RIFCSPLOWO2_01_FULL_42_22]